MSTINRKKRVNKERFLKAVRVFIFETFTLFDVIDENESFFKGGGYLDYYLVHASKFSREDLEDNIMFCQAINYLAKLTMEFSESEGLKKTKTITVDRALALSNAIVIFNYKFHNKKFIEWQKQVFQLLTFEKLTRKVKHSNLV